MKIKKGDTIEIITGKERGKRGTVEQISKSKDAVGGKVLIGGLNLAIRHKKAAAGRSSGKTGGRIEKPMPMDVSNVMLVCSKCDLKTRVETRVEGDSKKRVCKKCKKEI